MARVSFVVPTFNSARTLEACLTSVRAQRHPDIEVVVVDNSSTDATPRIAARWADRALDCGPERSAQRNLGWRTSTGTAVVFVDSDMVLEPDIATQALDAFAADSCLGGLVIPEFSFGPGFLARCRALEKRLCEGSAAVEGCRIFRREAVEQTGGYDESLYAGEDWEFSDRVAAAGWAVGRVRARVWHDEGHVRLADVYRKKRYYGASFADYLSLAAGERRPVARPALLSRPRMLLGAPHHAAGLAVLKAVEAAGLLHGAAAARLTPRPAGAI